MEVCFLKMSLLGSRYNNPDEDEAQIVRSGLQVCFNAFPYASEYRGVILIISNGNPW